MGITARETVEYREIVQGVQDIAEEHRGRRGGVMSAYEYVRRGSEGGHPS